MIRKETFYTLAVSFIHNEDKEFMCKSIKNFMACQNVCVNFIVLTLFRQHKLHRKNMSGVLNADAAGVLKYILRC